MLGKIVEKLGPELSKICYVTGNAIADLLDKTVDKVFDHLEEKKGGEANHI